MTIGVGISHKGIKDEDLQYPWNVSGTIAQTDLGKAVSQKTSADATVELAADGADIMGFLETYENRTAEGIAVGTVGMGGGYEIQIATAALGGSDEPAVGDGVIGAGSGLVKKGSSKRWVVTAKRTVNSDKFVTVIRA